VAVEPKMERKEISTTDAGFDFAIEFRQLLTQSRHFGQLSRFQMSRRKSVLPGEMMLGARAVSMKSLPPSIR